MNGIIARIDLILSSDGWKRTAMLQILRDELVEKRDAALKAKEISQETLKVEIKDGEIKTDWKVPSEVDKEKIHLAAAIFSGQPIEDKDLIAHGKELIEEYFPEQ